MILYTKQDDRAALSAPVEGNPQLYKNIKLDGSNLICIAGRPGMGKNIVCIAFGSRVCEK